MSNFAAGLNLDIDAARVHLRIDGREQDGEIAEKLLLATAMVSLYIGTTATTPYTLTDIYALSEADQAALIAAEQANWPNRALDAAVLLVLGELWQNRESSTADPLSPAVKNILCLFRTPGYA